MGENRILSIPNLCLFFIFIIGLSFTFLVPPFQKPDENRHYYQARALSRGVFTCQSNDQDGIFLPMAERAYNFPNDLKVMEVAHTPDLKFFRSQFGWFLENGNDKIVNVRDWCSWSFVGYVPSAIGMVLGRVTSSLMIEFYLARLISFLVFFVCLVYGIKNTPLSYQKWLLFFGLVPMTIHQASAISYDSVQLAMIPIIFAYVIQFLENINQIISKKSVIIFLISLIIFVLAKPTSIPFLLLVFLIPKEKFSKLSIIFILLILITLPFLRSQHTLNLGGGVDTSLQLSIIFRDPLYFISVFIHTISIDTKDIVTGLIGNLGWLDYQFSYGFYLVYILIFGYCLSLSTDNTKNIPWYKLLVLILVILGSYGLTYLSLYIIWTNVGDRTIGGVQGRYFLTLIPFFGILLSQIIFNLKSSKKWQFIVLSVFSCWLIIQVVSAVYVRYWDYSNYGTNDIQMESKETSPISLTKSTHTLMLPGSSAKGVGFYFHIAGQPNRETSYRYAIKSSDCSKILRIGYFMIPSPDRNNDYLVKTKIFGITDGKLCLDIEPLSSGIDHTTSVVPYSDGSIFQPLYLIPSLRQL